MAKSKVASAKPAKADKALTSVKAGGVTKASQSSKAKSSKIAKETAKKADLKKMKEPESEEEDSDSASSASSASDSDSESASESEAEAKKPAAKAKAQANGKATKKANSDSESGDSSEEESDDDSSEDEKNAKTKANGATKSKAAPKKVAKDESDDSSDESDSSDEEEKPTKKTSKNAEAESSDDSESDSGSEDDDDDEDEEEEEKPKKRKAEDVAPAESKKQKTDLSQANPNASKNLFVGSLSWNVDDEWLQRDFSVHGEVVRARVMADRQSGRSKGFGYVEFSTLEDAIKAHDAMKGTEMDGRNINVDYSQPRPDNGGQNREQRARSFNDKTSDPSDILFVGNVAFGTDESTISDVFGEYGSVMSVRLPTDPDTGNIKGFGYVQFSSVDEAKSAFEALNGVEIAGRPVRLDYSQPRPNNGGSPRGGRGGPRGGGFRGSGGRGGGRGGAPRGGRGGFSTNRGGFGDFQGKKVTF